MIFVNPSFILFRNRNKKGCVNNLLFLKEKRAKNRNRQKLKREKPSEKVEAVKSNIIRCLHTAYSSLGKNYIHISRRECVPIYYTRSSKSQYEWKTCGNKHKRFPILLDLLRTRIEWVEAHCALVWCK